MLKLEMFVVNMTNQNCLFNQIGHIDIHVVDVVPSWICIFLCNVIKINDLSELWHVIIMLFLMLLFCMKY
jgi:hypothetical protein